jgi:hypothetical protein
MSICHLKYENFLATNANYVLLGDDRKCLICRQYAGFHSSKDSQSSAAYNHYNEPSSNSNDNRSSSPNPIKASVGRGMIQQSAAKSFSADVRKLAASPVMKSPTTVKPPLISKPTSSLINFRFIALMCNEVTLSGVPKQINSRTALIYPTNKKEIDLSVIPSTLFNDNASQFKKLLYSGNILGFPNGIKFDTALTLFDQLKANFGPVKKAIDDGETIVVLKKKNSEGRSIGGATNVLEQTLWSSENPPSWNELFKNVFVHSSRRDVIDLYLGFDEENTSNIHEVPLNLTFGTTLTQPIANSLVTCVSCNRTGEFSKIDLRYCHHITCYECLDKHFGRTNGDYQCKFPGCQTLYELCLFEYQFANTRIMDKINANVPIDDDYTSITSSNVNSHVDIVGENLNASYDLTNKNEENHTKEINIEDESSVTDVSTLFNPKSKHSRKKKRKDLTEQKTNPLVLGIVMNNKRKRAKNSRYT